MHPVWTNRLVAQNDLSDLDRDPHKYLGANHRQGSCVPVQSPKVWDSEIPQNTLAKTIDKDRVFVCSFKKFEKSHRRIYSSCFAPIEESIYKQPWRQKKTQ